MEKDIGSVQRQLAKPGSALAKYKEAMVGNRGLLHMLYAELTVLFLGSAGGNAGAAARRVLLQPVFRHIGSDVHIGREFSFRRPHRIEIHEGSCLADEVTLNVKSEDGEIILGMNTRIGEKVIFSCPGGRLEVGEKTHIGRFSRLGSLLGLTVGKNCRIGESSYIVGAGHAISALDIPIINQPITCNGPNTIGDNVVIGDRVTILDGVIIGENAVIESDSVVIRNVPANYRVSGVPAVPVGEGGGLMKNLLHRFLRWCPGALGLWLRGKLYPAYFGSCGRGVLFGRFIDFCGAERIYLGNRVVISNGVVLDAGESVESPGQISLGDEVFIGAETTLSAAGGGHIGIERGSNFSSYCTIRTRDKFTMGPDCLVAGYCFFGENSEEQTGKDIDIEGGCWLGVRLRVNPGVSIGHDAIVGAHAVADSDIGPFAIAVGNPAKVIKIRGKG